MQNSRFRDIRIKCYNVYCYQMLQRKKFNTIDILNIGGWN